MTPTVLRQLYAYDRWANRRLLAVLSAMPAADATRDMGAHWSYPTLKGMFAHVLGAEAIWLARCRGDSPPRLLGDADFADVPALLERWEVVERNVQGFVEGLGEPELARLVDYRNTRGEAFRLPLWALLQHVANHSTHHRSEAAAMITLLQGSPPPTDLLVYHLVASGQARA